MNVNGKKEIDIKRYSKIEKIPGGDICDSIVIKGIMVNKDVIHSKMSRKILNPRILLLDCTLEYKKTESNCSVEISNSNDWNKLLLIEEEYIKNMCDIINKFKPDLVITEKGVSDLAQHYFVKYNITALRRVRKTDNIRIGRATGATIVHRMEEIKESDIGTECGLFEMRKIGDETFCFIENCKNPKACTVLLRGGSKDVLNEIERNLQDAMKVVKNIYSDPRLLPGGGATEMALSVAIREQSRQIEGVEQEPFAAIGDAFEIIPRTLCQNCGGDPIRVITELRVKHANNNNCTLGINGITGKIADMKELNIWDAFQVKTQTIKTAIENACMLMRIDDIVSGMKKIK